MRKSKWLWSERTSVLLVFPQSRTPSLPLCEKGHLLSVSHPNLRIETVTYSTKTVQVLLSNFPCLCFHGSQQKLQRITQSRPPQAIATTKWFFLAAILAVSLRHISYFVVLILVLHWHQTTFGDAGTRLFCLILSCFFEKAIQARAHTERWNESSLISINFDARLLRCNSTSTFYTFKYEAWILKLYKNFEW